MKSPSPTSTPLSPNLVAATPTASLRDLRTEDLNNFSYIPNNPSAIEEQRIQRLIEDKLLTSTNALQSPKLPSITSPIISITKASTQRIPTSPLEISAAQAAAQVTPIFSLTNDVLPYIQSGLENVVQDDFSRCFESSRSPPWNWNFYLYPLWLGGVFIRYCILFPIRFTALLMGFVVFAISLFVLKITVPATTRPNYERALIRLLCSVFAFSWTAVIKYHGTLPKHVPNRIYVANHTSLIDMVVLSQMHTFSLVGQKQKGFVGFFQNHVLSCLSNCWFDRAESNDRLAAARRIREHISDPNKSRLLIFPEGTCVNNEYCVQFKQVSIIQFKCSY